MVSIDFHRENIKKIFTTSHCDHKPISSIMKKPLSAARPLLQRMLLHLQKQHVTVDHVSGKDIPRSDCLSAPTPKTSPKLIEGLDLNVHAVKQPIFMTDRRLKFVQLAQM